MHRIFNANASVLAFQSNTDHADEQNGMYASNIDTFLAGITHICEMLFLLILDGLSNQLYLTRNRLEDCWWFTLVAVKILATRFVASDALDHDPSLELVPDRGFSPLRPSGLPCFD